MEDSKASKIRDHILRKFQRAANIWKLKIEIKSLKDQTKLRIFQKIEKKKTKKKKYERKENMTNLQVLRAE